MVIYRACTALPTLRNEKGTKCMLGSVALSISMYCILIFSGAIYSLVYRACKFLWIISPTQVNIRKAGWPNHQKKEIVTCILITIWQISVHTSKIIFLNVSYFSKCYLSVIWHCQVDNKEWHIYIYNIDNFRIFLFS